MKNLLAPIVEGFIKDVELLKAGEIEIDHYRKVLSGNAANNNQLQVLEGKVDDIVANITRALSYARL